MRYWLVLLLGLASVRVLPADEIIRKDQRPGRSNPYADVIILKETYNKIYYRFKYSPARQQMDRSLIRSYRYDKSKIPSEYAVAQKHFQAAHYSKALALYQRALHMTFRYQYKWIKQHCLFKIAQCYRLLGKTREAISYYQKLNREFRDGLYYPDALLYIARCYLQDRRLYQARNAFSKALRTFQRLHLPCKEIEALYWRTVLQEQNKAYQSAVQGYRQVASRAQQHNMSELAHQALIRLGNCYLAQEQGRQAREVYLELLRKIAQARKISQDTMGGIYLGLGDSYFQQRDWQKALLCYLRVMLMYKGMQDEEGLGKAYYHAAWCFHLLKEPGGRRRARELYDELKARCPDSSWSQRRPKW